MKNRRHTLTSNIPTLKFGKTKRSKILRKVGVNLVTSLESINSLIILRHFVMTSGSIFSLSKF